MNKLIWYKPLKDQPHDAVAYKYIVFIRFR